MTAARANRPPTSMPDNGMIIGGGENSLELHIPDPDETDVPQRRIRFTRASTITPKRAKWLWDRRIPFGEFTLLGGREGIGKSTVAYTLVADITKGRMAGEYEGQPRNVAIAATEDSWEYTIVPRLMAADADLTRIFRIDVVATDGHYSVLTLPRDLEDTERALRMYDVALLLLDPLMSRLSAALDTHKDSEVRQALEPLVQIGQRTGTSVVGLIHVSKGQAKDPLTAIMGSRAFVAVARSVLYVMTDPDDEQQRLLGLAKSNLGPTDLPVLSFVIHSVQVADTDDGPVMSGRVMWGYDRAESIADLHESSADSLRGDVTSSEVDLWLEGLMAREGGSVKASEVYAMAKKDSIPDSTLKRARKRLGIAAERKGFGEGSWWTWDPNRKRPRRLKADQGGPSSPPPDVDGPGSIDRPAGGSADRADDGPDGLPRGRGGSGDIPLPPEPPEGEPFDDPYGEGA